MSQLIVVVQKLFVDVCVNILQIGEEALACRNAAAIFNLSYFCKLVMSGPDAKKAADWIFSANTNRDASK